MSGASASVFAGVNAILVAVFAVAGLSKLRTSFLTRTMLVDFGVPVSIAWWTADLLAPVELAVSLALVLPVTSWFGAVGATVLLSLFTLAISVNIARGRRPACSCFGLSGTVRIGRRTLLRNAALLCLALFSLSAGPAAEARASFVNLAWWHPAALRAIGLLAALAYVGLNRRRLRHAPDRKIAKPVSATSKYRAMAAPPSEHRKGLAVGTPAPPFRLRDHLGSEIALHDILDGRRDVILIFTKVDCLACKAFAPEVSRWEKRLADRVQFVHINEGKPESRPAGITLFQDKREVSDVYGCRGTPSAIAIGADGHIASEIAQGVMAVRKLVKRMTETNVSPPSWQTGIANSTLNPGA